MQKEPEDFGDWLNWWGERMVATGRLDAASAVFAAEMKYRQACLDAEPDNDEHDDFNDLAELDDPNGDGT